MAYTSISLAVVAILIMSQGVIAKRGCSAFGHSCFGGHGKRSSELSAIDVSSNDVSRQLGQEETPPHPGYPRVYNLPTGDDIIPVRDGGLYDREDSTEKEAMRYHLRDVVRHWMDHYRRSQNDDGNFV